MEAGTSRAAPGDAGEPGGDSGIAVGAQERFDIGAGRGGRDSSGRFRSSNPGASGGKPGRKPGRPAASRDSEGAPKQASRVTFSVRRSLSDTSKLLQRKFGGQIQQIQEDGSTKIVDLWTFDKDELDILTNAVEGVRGRLVALPEKWALPVAVLWLGGVTVALFSQRIAIYRELKAAAAGQQQAAAQQQAVDAHRNGHTPTQAAQPGMPFTYAETPEGERVMVAVLDESGNAPAGWDQALWPGGRAPEPE